MVITNQYLYSFIHLPLSGEFVRGIQRGFIGIISHHVYQYFVDDYYRNNIQKLSEIKLRFQINNGDNVAVYDKLYCENIIFC